MSRFILSLFLLTFANLFSQNDSINVLEEIVLRGSFSPNLNSGYTIETIKDSVLKNNYQSLGSLLQNQVNLYFKQNGNGMVSSISLRGTNASQTGVFWNGIAINSALNGQVDFNTLSANTFDEVEIRRGGGSVLLGSGSIGGAINLKDRVIFQKEKKASLYVGLASFQTFSTQFNGIISNNKMFAKISLGGLTSDNDYPYSDSDLKNENGEFKNYNINGTFAYAINEKNRISLNTSLFDNDRNTSGTLTAASNSKLLNTDFRNLIDWQYLGNKFTSSLKFAFLYEEFTFIFDKELDNSSKGKSNSSIGKYDLTYYLNNKIFFNSGLEFRNAKANGDNIDNAQQNDLSAYVLFHHQPIQRLNYNLSIRKGTSSVYEIPFIYAFDAKYDLQNKLTIKTAFSTNYRIPTFNDLYWVPGGNTDLRSEKSKSAEIGLDYTNKNFNISITSFYIKSKDLIQWQPVSGTFWQPQNIQDVINYGIEFSTLVQKKFDRHLFRMNIKYDYTRSRDKETDKELIYVPNHKANGIINYFYGKWNFAYNLQYTGRVYITTSNSQTLDSYLLSNIDISRSFLKKNRLLVVLKINNLFDENYQSVGFRPMPNRNFAININLKI
jgi:iron complex outermembrane receptor protein